ncbi:MAG: RNA pseudouridine synthase, partial [Bacteroidota bacterium]
MDTNTQIGDLVLYKNNQLIAFNKPAGLPVQPDKTKDKSLLSLAEIYSKSKIQLLHRIDRPASGIVLFAKTQRATQSLNQQLQERTVKKTYLAVVKNKPSESNGTLIHYLKKLSKSKKSIALEEGTAGAKRAELEYQVLASSEQYHLLEIALKTGRFHQIRAQLAAIDCPIKGDVKYGFRRSNTDRSIHLHAWKMSFQHPVTKQLEKVVAPLPEENLWQAFK